jgi:uridine kinase
MSEQIKVTINGEDRVYEKDITFEMIAKEFQNQVADPIVLVYQNGRIRELFRKVQIDCKVEFITLADTLGHKAYERTATMLLFKSLYDIIGYENITKSKVEFSLGAGLFCRCEGDFTLTYDLVKQVQSRMEFLRDAAIPVVKTPMRKTDAMEMFAGFGMYDKVDLLRFRTSSEVNVYTMNKYKDYYYGYMLSNTSYVTTFRLDVFEGGIMLMLPNRKEHNIIPQADPRHKLFRTLDSATKWNGTMGIDNVGDLNKQICDDNFNQLLLVQEAIMESKIGEIAGRIAKKDGIKFIMIAGPSSSGKTTFSNRLSIQLLAHGLKPHPIGVDNYFVNREDTPKDENGDYNFECLEAIDVKQFNEDMTRLLSGEEVEIPRFNFIYGKRIYDGNKIKLGDEDVLVIEGIHALNDKMSYELPKESKYKIYISALTTLNVDEHNRIPTTDARLLRRMVRDARTRGASAKRTFEMWPSVRRGEEENIFPYQESADVMFNSTSIYELAVLKQFAEPLLFNIKEDEPEFYEAKRLLKFLDYFLGVSSEDVPNNAIIREFIGGSCFDV